MAKRTNPEIESEVLRFYKEGKTQRQIGLKLNIKPETVAAILKRNNIETGLNLKRFTDEEEKTIIQEYTNGKSLNELGRQYKSDHVTIYNVLKRNNIEIRRPGNEEIILTDEQRDLANKLINSGASHKLIAESLNICNSAFVTIMERNGISIPYRRAARENHGNWKGGKTIDKYGYVQIKLERSDPHFSMTNTVGYVREHRLVMARYHGRCLTREEEIHHKNGVKTDNRLDNLELRKRYHGAGQKWRCRCCGSEDIEAIELK